MRELACFASVIFDRASVAERVALGVTFGVYLIESLLRGTDYEVVGVIAPMRCFDPDEVLLESTYDLVGVAVLVGMTGLLLVGSQAWFVRRDI